jgi:hypothetical protein
VECHVILLGLAAAVRTLFDLSRHKPLVRLPSKLPPAVTPQLSQSSEKSAHLHLAFVANTRKQVEDFYRAALEAGGKDNGAPGLRPHYHPNYYGALVIGPDGHNVEAVCHKAEV